MGIQGLLPFLKKASRPASIKEFRGCTVAIDTYCWLHRGAFACAEKLALGESTDQYVHYCMKYVNSLLSFGIKPIMVFDGCHLPSKKVVETVRRERREAYRKKAAQFLREGKRSEARDCFTKCIDITPQMALCLMDACRYRGVDCIVAPYEADAQLAFFSQSGMAQVVITEDSDLVLFGCQKIMFKMDFNGNGLLIEKSQLNQAMELKANCFTFEKFRYMCILSGCDYMQSLPGIGLGKANKVFKLTRQTDINVVLKKLPSTLNMPSLSVSTEYIEGFHRANNTFLYQLVYDPCRRQLIPLKPYPPEVDPSSMQYAGPYIEAERAYQIALGNIDIYTGQKISNFDPTQAKRQSFKKSGSDEKQLLHMPSIWDINYCPSSKMTPKLRSPSRPPSDVTVRLPLKMMHKPNSSVKRKYEVDEMSEDLVLSVYNSQPPRICSAEINGAEDAAAGFSSLDCSHSKVQEPNMQEESPKARAENIPEKEWVSPKNRNKFAVSKRSSIRKFSLDAQRSPEAEVKSRFFRSKEPLSQTKFYQELDRGHHQDQTDASTSCSVFEDNERIQREMSFFSMDVNSSIANNSITDSPKFFEKTSLDDMQKKNYYNSSFEFTSKTDSSDKFESFFFNKDRKLTDKNLPVSAFKPVKPRSSVTHSTSFNIHAIHSDNLANECSGQEKTNGNQHMAPVYTLQRINLFHAELNNEQDLDVDKVAKMHGALGAPDSLSEQFGHRAETVPHFLQADISSDAHKESVHSKMSSDFCATIEPLAANTDMCIKPSLYDSSGFSSGCRSLGLSKAGIISQKPQPSISARTPKDTDKSQPSIKHFFGQFKYKKKT